jgi:hypothetical protein
MSYEIKYSIRINLFLYIKSIFVTIIVKQNIARPL